MGEERTARDMLFSSHRRDNRVASFSSATLYAAACAVAVMIARRGANLTETGAPLRAGIVGRVNPSRLIAERLRELEQPQSKVSEKSAVHQMRVAARRLRAALRILRLRRLDPAVKALQDALGDVRDLQLQIAWLRSRDETLTRGREARLRKAEQTLGRALQRWRAQTAPALLDAGVQARAPHRRRVRKVVCNRLRRLEARLEQARVRPTPRSVHSARISVKQVRYLIEVGEKLLPSRVVRTVADLKSLQASLGQLHDADLRIGLVKTRPLLLREQREAREHLAKIVSSQLTRWKKQEVAAHALKRLQ
jgi:CHAD domain-containing protein